MRAFRINEMAMAATKVIGGDMDTFKSISSTFDAYWKDKIALVWTRVDVEDRASELGIPLSPEEACTVLKALLNNHDAEQGVNWDVIDEAIRQFVKARKTGEEV